MIGTASVVRVVLITIVLMSLTLLLWAGRDVLFILFFGVLVGIVLSVFADRLAGWGVPRLAAVLLVLLAILGLLTAFAVLLWPTVREQLGIVGRELPRAVEDVVRWIQAQYGAVIEPGEPVPDLEEEVQSSLPIRPGAIISGAIPIINTAVGALTGALVGLAVGVYTAINPGLYRRGLERLTPPVHRERAGLALDRANHSLRRWMVGTLINMVVVGVMTGTGLMLIGVPAPIALGVIAGLLEFIPIVGPILASVPGIALALTVSPVTALWVTIFYIVVQQIEGNVLMPVIMRGAVRLPPALTVLFQTLMAVTFGFLGLLLAVPLLAVAVVMAKTLYVEPMESGTPDEA
ncbi:MAG: AI-2E family transporter [Candidatus Krumholzibacteriia bacterium]